MKLRVLPEMDEILCVGYVRAGGGTHLTHVKDYDSYAVQAGEPVQQRYERSRQMRGGAL